MAVWEMIAHVFVRAECGCAVLDALLRCYTVIYLQSIATLLMTECCGKRGSSTTKSATTTKRPGSMSDSPLAAPLRFYLGWVNVETALNGQLFMFYHFLIYESGKDY